jgi:hypothetical protein
MKKITILTISLLMIAISSNAQTLNNPTDADGYYIVKWDCSQGAFAASNDLEADETFTFAVDVTGATRALAFYSGTSYGDVSGGTNRLKQISGNVFGATWNLIQMASTMDVDKATGTDSILYIYGQVFGFEFTADNPGAGWWMWPDGMDVVAIDPGTGSIFKTLPYTGTKTSDEFYSDDYDGGLFLSNNTPEKGYSVPCAQSSATAVTDINNEIVIGATISASLSGELVGGTISDPNGNFELSAPAGSILQVSFIGYESYQEAITESKNIYNVVLSEDIQSLDEVVVIGYGTQKRSELTGSISSVNAEDVKDFSSKSLAESISGMAAGVMVTKNEGTPGSEADIIIRGAGSLNGMAPLYVVDGVPQDAGFRFNMRDVASIEILKDAGSAAIYGSRAAHRRVDSSPRRFRYRKQPGCSWSGKH